MTRGEALSYAYALKHNYTVDLNKMPDFAQSIIYLLSFEPCDDCIQPISNDTCSTCKFASIHCTEHDMDVAATDGCCDWEE